MKLFPAVIVFYLAFFGLAGCRDDTTVPATTRPEQSFAGLHYRVVWVQDAGKNKDVFCRGRQLRLMALDSTDARGERVVVDQVGSFVKPLLTADGSRIVYTSYDQQGRSSVWLVDWQGTGSKRIASGRALDILQDPGSDREWVYFQKNPGAGQPEDNGVLYRRLLAGEEKEEQVWPGKRISLSQDSFQLSADGSMAAGLFPWPRAGTISLADARITAYGRGCWTSLAPDNSFLLWIFQDNHRAMTMIDTVAEKQWQLDVSTSKYINGHEIYHPRWSNIKKYIVLSGPYTIMQGGNAIRGGGAGVEILIGRFNDEMTTMDGWLRVTNNQNADFFPDLWIDPKTTGTGNVVER